MLPLRDLWFQGHEGTFSKTKGSGIGKYLFPRYTVYAVSRAPGAPKWVYVITTGGPSKAVLGRGLHQVCVYFLINTCLTGLRSWKSSGGKYPCASSLA